MFQKLPYLILFALSGLCIWAQQPILSFEDFSTYGIPIDIEHAGDERLFIASKEGTIVIANEQGILNSTLFLAINNQVSNSDYEGGLLGLAFHLNHASNGYFYVNYTNLEGNTVVSRFSVYPSNRDLANPYSEEILLTIDQYSPSHNGGDICFGPDGYLYISVGDGGGVGDPNQNGQNNNTFLGKILRIDVNNTSTIINSDGETIELPYAIPTDNPFVNNPDVADEIWATGLRNPWRMSFDNLTGDLWIADVGQGEWEEVNFQSQLSEGGENYGWNCYEGNHPFPVNNEDIDCENQNFTFPTFEYGHNSNGGFAVTGGFVYRGTQYPCLYGKYLMADFVTGNIWTLEPDDIADMNTDGTVQTWTNTFYDNSVFQFPSDITSFGEDINGELYAATFDGTVYKLTTECSVNANVNLKIFLEGAYINNGEMATTLHDYIPLEQPYNNPPYNYTGTESLNNIPNNMVDWVLVEARQGQPNIAGNKNTTITQTKAGVLLSNGNIVDTSGEPLIFFDLKIDEEYYFCVRHRNHLDILTAIPIATAPNIEYDFTLNHTSALGNQQLIQMNDGRFAMFAGDFLPDGVIQTTDYDTWVNAPAILGTYNSNDGNLDGTIQVTDRDLWYPNRSKTGIAEIEF